MDSIPLVVITGQVATPLIGKDGFQEADVVGITVPVTKHNYQVRDVNHVSRIVQEALHRRKRTPTSINRYSKRCSKCKSHQFL